MRNSLYFGFSYNDSGCFHKQEKLIKSLNMFLLNPGLCFQRSHTCTGRNLQVNPASCRHRNPTFQVVASSGAFWIAWIPGAALGPQPNHKLPFPGRLGGWPSPGKQHLQDALRAKTTPSFPEATWVLHFKILAHSLPAPYTTAILSSPYPRYRYFHYLSCENILLYCFNIKHWSS